MDDFCPQRRGAGLRTLAEHRALQLQQRTKHPISPAAVGNGTDQVATAVSKAGDEPPNGGVQMWCGAEDYLGAWRDMPAVLAAMHVEASADHDAFDYTIEPQDLSPTYRKLASDPSLRFVIYNGQSDANVPWNGQCQYWATPDQGWYPLAAPEGWQPWYRAGPAAPAAGHVRTYIHTRGSPNGGTLDRTFKFGARHTSSLSTKSRVAESGAPATRSDGRRRGPRGAELSAGRGADDAAVLRAVRRRRRPPNVLRLARLASV